MVKREKELEEEKVEKYLIRQLNGWTDYKWGIGWSVGVYDTLEEAEKELNSMMTGDYAGNQGYIILKTIVKVRNQDKLVLDGNEVEKQFLVFYRHGWNNVIFLGIGKGYDKQDVIDKLSADTSWIEKSLVLYALKPNGTIHSVKKVIDFIEDKRQARNGGFIDNPKKWKKANETYDIEPVYSKCEQVNLKELIKKTMEAK